MLKVHFLNVGHGDCTIIEHASGRISMIDINNGMELDLQSEEELAGSFSLSESVRKALSAASDTPYTLALLRNTTKALAVKAAQRAAYEELITKGYNIPLTNPIEFLKHAYAGRRIHRYIQSHPDLDHMRGLDALRSENVGINSFWDTSHEKEPDVLSDADQDDWEAYQELGQSTKDPNVLHITRGETGQYWNEEPVGTAGGDGIEILSPTTAIIDAANESGNTNNLSYVLQLTYKGVKVLLPGDAEAVVWDDLVANYGSKLKCDVLKASHHGRDTGYHQKAVELMRPQYTIVSVGKKPETDASNKYRYYTSKGVWSTRWRGDITLTIDDDGTFTLTSEYNR